MKKTNRLYVSLVFIITLQVAPFSSVSAGEGLIEYMGSLQYFAHKTGLAIDNKNTKLASFYAHEIEETLKEVEKIESFDGHKIGEMAKMTLEPALESLEDAIKSEQWPATSVSFDKLLNACNRCHQDAEHGYIKITRQTQNPYMQNFAP